MQILKMIELLHITRAELCGLEARAVIELYQASEVSGDRARASINIRNIRRILA
jgi:hypothetical protein